MYVGQPTQLSNITRGPNSVNTGRDDIVEADCYVVDNWWNWPYTYVRT